MLAKKYRLPIQFFPRTGVRAARNAHFSLKVVSNTLTHPRFGVLVSKKTAKEATKRNAIKRRIFRFLQENEFYKKSASKDVLLIPSSVGALTDSEFVASLREVFAKI